MSYKSETSESMRVHAKHRRELTEARNNAFRQLELGYHPTEVINTARAAYRRSFHAYLLAMGR